MRLKADLWNAVVRKAEASGLSASRLAEQVLMENVGLTPANTIKDQVELKKTSDARRSRRSLLIDDVIWDQLRIEGRRRGVSVATVVREFLWDAVSSVATSRAPIEQTGMRVLQKTSSDENDPAPEIKSIKVFDL